MEVWSGQTASCVRADKSLKIETSSKFAITFDDKETPPLQPKQEHQPDSVSPGSGKVSALCKVCGDKASGYHYGVTSCEGCKGFFRRSIQKQIEYRCLRDGKCLVIRLNRNRCQFCRFKKCLSVGMSRDSVRYGRVPKKTRETVSTELAKAKKMNSDLPNLVPVPEIELDAAALELDLTKELAKVVVDAHHANNTYTFALKQQLHIRVLRLNPAGPATEERENAASPTAAAERRLKALTVLWHNVAIRVTPAVQQVVEFAKRMPGFSILPQDDQLILIKLGFFEVWLTRACRLSTSNCIVFDDGTAVSLNQLEAMYNGLFARAMLDYVYTINAMQLTDEEMALYTASLLLTPTRSGLTDTERINSLHTTICGALNLVVSQRGIPVATRMNAFTNATVEVQNLSARHNRLLLWCRVHWSRLVLPSLFSEIFDIPKPESDVSALCERVIAPNDQLFQ